MSDKLFSVFVNWTPLTPAFHWLSNVTMLGECCSLAGLSSPLISDRCHLGAWNEVVIHASSAVSRESSELGLCFAAQVCGVVLSCVKVPLDVGPLVAVAEARSRLHWPAPVMPHGNQLTWLATSPGSWNPWTASPCS